ncbi:MAG TPA: hypothetical protein VHO25_01035 [Polyangiaceae bacterium]|nr:hypothetical protein [Polyangiaceae bacterium]
MARTVTNYEGKPLQAEQVEAFRNAVESEWIETLAAPGGIREWNKTLLAITEGRRTLKNKDGTTKVFYSWCGDWVTHHLELAGCFHGLALNRASLNGKWVPQMNLTWLRTWAGEPALQKRASPRARFKNDPSWGGASSKAMHWHPWDNKQNACKDGYEPQIADLILSPRKNGDHIEFVVKRHGDLLTVSAGAQVGGTARIRQRDLRTSQILGIIDVSALAPAEEY